MRRSLPRAAEKHVVVAVTLEGVLALVSVEIVDTDPADQLVIAVAAPDGVVSRGTVDEVVVEAPDQVVSSAGTG